MISAEYISGFLYSVIRITTPLLYGAMGALICKQGGVLHIAFEACMLFSAFFGMAASAVAQFELQCSTYRYCTKYAGIRWNCFSDVSDVRRKGNVQCSSKSGISCGGNSDY